MGAVSGGGGAGGGEPPVKPEAPKPGDTAALVLNPALYTITEYTAGDYAFKHGEPVKVDPKDVEGLTGRKVIQHGRDNQAVVTIEEARELHALYYSGSSAPAVPAIRDVEVSNG